MILKQYTITHVWKICNCYCNIRRSWSKKKEEEEEAGPQISLIMKEKIYINTF